MVLVKLDAAAQALAPNVKGFIQSKVDGNKPTLGTKPMSKVKGHSPQKLRRRMVTLH